jgi:hypothetical protein
MRRKLAFFFFMLLSASGISNAESTYVASTTGELVVGTDGQVDSVTLDHKELGQDVMRAFEQQISEWKFEPLIKDGKAVRARAGVHLDLMVRMPGADGSATLMVRGVRFSEPPDAENAGGTERAAGPIPKGQVLSPPQYPSQPLRAAAGAKIWLVVRLDEEGRVARVGTRSAELFNVTDRSAAWQKNYLGQFVEAAEKAAKDWRLPAYAGTDVCIPVAFKLPGDDGRRWLPRQNMPVEYPAWALSRKDETTQLSGSGEASSGRFRLLTSLD